MGRNQSNISIPTPSSLLEFLSCPCIIMSFIPYNINDTCERSKSKNNFSKIFEYVQKIDRLTTFTYRLLSELVKLNLVAFPIAEHHSLQSIFLFYKI